MALTEYLHIADANIPPASAADLPARTVGVLGYLGGPNATRPAGWSLEEWLRFAHLLQMGIYVPDLGGNPVTEAKAAAELAHARGFARGRGILLDFEASNDPAFVGEMGLKVRDHGFTPIGYESTGVLNANPRLDGLVLAKPDNVPNVPAGPLIIGHQYRFDVPCGKTVVDLSVFDSSARHLFGHGPRK